MTSEIRVHGVDCCGSRRNSTRRFDCGTKHKFTCLLEGIASIQKNDMQAGC
jgi:hypothetical protein